MCALCDKGVKNKTLDIGDLVTYNYKGNIIVGIIIARAPFDTNVFDVQWYDESADIGRYDAEQLLEWTHG
jgi:hypothetical protein